MELDPELFFMELDHESELDQEYKKELEQKTDQELVDEYNLSTKTESESESEYKSDIDIMLRIQTYLQKIRFDLRNNDYNEIVKLVDNYIHNNNQCPNKDKDNKDNCDHNIIRDDIDLTPDSSMVIYYCTKCYYQPSQ